MASFDYAKSQNTALGLLNKFGRDVQLIQTTNGTRDNVTGSVTNAQDRVCTVRAATLSNSKALDEMYKETGVVRGSLRYVIMEGKNAPADVVPGNKLKFENTVWEVTPGVTPIDPAGTVVIYKMIIQRA